MQLDGSNRLGEIETEIRRLEASLAKSPDDAFGYLELGCLFAEVDRRDAAIEAFRSSYAHRSGGQVLKPGTGPLIAGQLREAFEVTLGQTPPERRSQTRHLFEEALKNQKGIALPPAGLYLAGAGVVLVTALIGFLSPPVTMAPGGEYWPSFSLQHRMGDLPPAVITIKPSEGNPR